VTSQAAKREKHCPHCVFPSVYFRPWKVGCRTRNRGEMEFVYAFSVNEASERRDKCFVVTKLVLYGLQIQS